MWFVIFLLCSLLYLAIGTAIVIFFHVWEKEEEYDNRDVVLILIWPIGLVVILYIMAEEKIPTYLKRVTKHYIDKRKKK